MQLPARPDLEAEAASAAASSGKGAKPGAKGTKK